MSRIFARTNAGRRRRPARTLGGFVAAVLATVASLSFGVTGAFAHHPEVTANITCGGLVSFTSTAWTTSDVPARTNPVIQVSYSTNGGTTFTALTQNLAYHFGLDNGYSFSDSFQLSSPLTSSVIVKVQALTNWANGAGPGGSRQTSVLTRPTCPPAPRASIADVDCAKNGVGVTLANGGEESVTFTVRKDNQVIDTVPVTGGATVNKTYPLGEDETATIKVTAPDMDDVVRALTRSCEKPDADVSVSCKAGGAYMTFDNEGDSATTFTVYKGEAQIDSFNVDGHDDAVRSYEMDENESATFTVSSTGGMEDVVTELTYDCQRPSASLSDVDCSEDGITATLTNDGELPVTFTVWKGQEIIDTVEVEGGASEERAYGLDEDETATFTISAPGMDDVSREVARDCERPSADIAADCAEGGAVVSFANDGESTTTFTVRKNGEVIDTVDVEGGASDERTYALDEDETATFEVSSNGGMEDVEATIEHDCEEPVTPPTTPPITPVPPAVVPQVLSTSFTPAAPDDETLPVTGSEPLPLAEAGLGLLLLGSLLVRRYRTNNA